MNAITASRRAKPAWLEQADADFAARYDALKSESPGDQALRAAGAAAFHDFGLPTPRDEDWHYTSLRRLAELRFAEPSAPANVNALLAHLPSLDAPRIVFVNGRLREDLSRIPESLTMRTGSPAYGRLARPVRERMVALNTMLSTDGAAITVPADVDGGLLILANVSLANGERPVACYPRHSIQLRAGAALTLLDLSVGDGGYLNNAVIEIELAKHARLAHLRVQDESRAAFHISTAYADVAEGGTYDSFALTLGGRLARMEAHVLLSGEGATAHLNAAQLLDGSQHADFTTAVTHAAPRCTSRQTVKNVLAGRSRGVFQGKIEVSPGAQKTDGYQMNQALLLSPDAEVDSKPQLEIYADDVKCSHGATVGELDAEQLFYLRSRGIAEAEARAILVRAFLSGALDLVGHSVAREALEAAIARRWEGIAP